MTTDNKEQKPCMQVEPQMEHHWLQKLVGEWTYEGEALMEPGKPPEKWRGSEAVRSLGGLWILPKDRAKCPAAAPQPWY